VPTERVAWYRGEIVPESQVRISFRDSAAVRGEGVYDTERTFDGRIFRLEQHLERLWRSMAYLGIAPPIERAELASITEEVARRNVEIVGDDVWVTQRVSRGVGREAGGDGEPTLIVESLPIPFATRAAGYRAGVRVVTSSLRRTPPWALSPQAKTTNLLNLMLGAAEVRATDPGAWPILLDEHGNLAEGSGANIFVVHGSRVSTPQVRYVLPGITRDVVLELAAGEGIEVVERDIDLFDAYTADEAFVTSTSLCACPVASINGRPMRAGAIPGPVTRRLQDAFRRAVGMDFVAQYLRYLPG
jgi:branched-chain amino acid aminotransferase